jgi:hypothetical protein
MLVLDVRSILNRPFGNGLPPNFRDCVKVSGGLKTGRPGWRLLACFSSPNSQERFTGACFVSGSYEGKIQAKGTRGVHERVLMQPYAVRFQPVHDIQFSHILETVDPLSSSAIFRTQLNPTSGSVTRQGGWGRSLERTLVT